MTTITIDRATVEQALEALEWHLARGAYGADIEGVTGNLRAALAQEQDEPTGKQPLQVESVATTQQPAGETPPSDYRRGYWDGFNIGKREGRIKAEDELAKQAEPVEPVAWVRLEAWKSGKDWPDDCFTALPAEGLTPVYTAPPQRKLVPLTEEEIDGLVIQHAGYGRDNFYAVARAVERAHGIT